MLGAERKVVLTAADRARTAYHEAGHALVGMLTDGADPVRKVSIIPRGQSLGATYAAPDGDHLNYGEKSLVAKIRVAIAGRAAEEIVFGDLSTGAESDLRQLTAIAHAMVTRWGMSRQLGPLALEPEQAQGPPGIPTVSESTQRAIDDEVRRIVLAAEDAVTALVLEERRRLDALAHALLEHETLDQDAAYRAAGLDTPPHPLVASQPLA